ncbi:MAG: TonB-dependent receptor domain-containing protein [Bacteroidales bacterium]
MKRTVTLIYSLCISLLSFAYNVKGIVLDKETKEPLIGVSIYSKENKAIGTTTDLDGNFTLEINESNSPVLIVSYIGFEVQEISISKGNSPVRIYLAPESQHISTVQIVGTLKKNTDNGVRLLEQQSNKVVNMVSAKSMELSPDLNVASVLQRMSGVSMEKSSSGQGQYAILRGMDKRYNYTLVNNIKIPSPDNKNRYIPLNIFPSELLDRLEVSKSLTPDMESDATGGAINMIMKDCPDNILMQVNIGVGYESIFFDQKFNSALRSNIGTQSPREMYGTDHIAQISDFSKYGSKNSLRIALPNLAGGIALGNRFFDNRLGFILAGSYQGNTKGNNSVLFDDVMNQTEETVRLSTMRNRSYSERLSEYGTHLKLDYDINDNHQLKWYNGIIGSNSMQIRESKATNLSLNYQPENGNSLENIEIRSRYTQQNILVSNLQGFHRFFNTMSSDWSIVYSKASNQRPDNTYVNLENNRNSFEDHITADNSQKRWEKNSDQDIAGYLNLEGYKRLGRFDVSLKMGGMYRHKKRTNSFVSYMFTPESTSRPVYGKDFSSLDEIAWKVSTPKGSVGPLNYDAGENNSALYLMTNITRGMFNIIIGARAEFTNQNYYMLYPAAGDDPKGQQKYADLLPSINTKLSISNSMNVRASYFKSLNRPGFFEIVPFSIINEDYMEFGNKDLQRAIIHNIDLRWEFFPQLSEQVMAGLFYKKIKNPIEYAYHTINNRQFGYGPVNLGNATNYGVEIDLIKRLGDFEFKGNYTYTHSSITTPKTVYRRDDSGKLTKLSIDQTRPLVGQTPHLANITIGYNNKQLGTNIQISGSYSSEKIVIASHYLDSDYWQGRQFTLDCSIEKRFGQKLACFIKASNLLNTPIKRYIKTTNKYNENFAYQDINSGQTLIREDKVGGSILSGIRYTL